MSWELAVEFSHRKVPTSADRSDTWRTGKRCNDGITSAMIWRREPQMVQAVSGVTDHVVQMRRGMMLCSFGFLEVNGVIVVLFSILDSSNSRSTA